MVNKFIYYIIVRTEKQHSKDQPRAVRIGALLDSFTPGPARRILKSNNLELDFVYVNNTIGGYRS